MSVQTPNTSACTETRPETLSDPSPIQNVSGRQVDENVSWSNQQKRSVQHDLPETIEATNLNRSSSEELESTRLLHESENTDCRERYAKIDHIGPWVPETDPQHERAMSLGVKLARRSTMLIIQAGTAMVVALVIMALMAWSLSQYPVIADNGTFFTGSCLTVERWDTGVHLCLNVLSTLFLGAGNYAMQVLVAPSREEVDGAAKKNIALDIGIHSFRNVFHISFQRRITWVVLGAISTTLHLFFNSAVYSSIPFVIFPAAIVTSDFRTAGDDWAVSNPMVDSTITINSSDIYSLQTDAINFLELNNSECIREYISPSSATRKLVLVSTVSFGDNSTSDVQSSLLHGWISGSDHNRWNSATYWICYDFDSSASSSSACTLSWAETFSDKWSVNTYPIAYCLVGQAGDNDVRCGLHFSRTIFLVVASFMLVDSLMLVVVAWLWKAPTLVTLGDALASYLEKPTEQDPSTSASSGVALSQATWEPLPRFWYTAVSAKLWVATSALIVAAIILGFGLFA